MSHWVYRTPLSQPPMYLSSRTKSLPKWGGRRDTPTNATPYLQEARVFNSKAACNNAGRRDFEGEAIAVNIGRVLPGDEHL